MIVPEVCPRCRTNWIPTNEAPGQYPGALSKVDNKTEICSQCGHEEAGTTVNTVDQIKNMPITIIRGSAVLNCGCVVTPKLDIDTNERTCVISPCKQTCVAMQEIIFVTKNEPDHFMYGVQVYVLSDRDDAGTLA